MAQPLSNFLKQPIEKCKRKSPDTSLHKELVDFAYKWALKKTTCGIAFKELHSWARNGEYPDVIAFGSGGHSVLIECKANKNDFKKDSTKHFRKYPELGMGTQRFYLCPAGVIKKEELPEGWGLIYIIKNKPRVVFSPYTGNIRERHTGFNKNIKAEHGLMYSVLRRLHLRDLINEMYKPIK